jgi:hypothetical protein
MIKVIDLIKWAERMTVERSSKVPNGYIRGQDLHDLAKLIKKKEPKDFNLEDLGDRF